MISLTQRRLTDPAAVIAGLPRDMRPIPSLAEYDQLLHLPGNTKVGDQHARTEARI